MSDNRITDAITELGRRVRQLEAVETPVVGGGGTGAPSNAQYVVMANTGDLSAERALVAGPDTTIADGGANSTVTVGRNGDKVLRFRAGAQVAEYASTGAGIAAAVAAAAVGDIVKFYAQSIALVGVLVIPAGIYVVGENRDGSVLVGDVTVQGRLVNIHVDGHITVDGGWARNCEIVATSGNGITITAGNVTWCDVGLNGCDWGIYASAGDWIYIANSKVANYGSGGSGLFCNSTQAQIKHNRFEAYGAGKVGVQVESCFFYSHNFAASVNGDALVHTTGSGVICNSDFYANLLSGLGKGVNLSAAGLEFTDCSWDSIAGANFITYGQGDRSSYSVTAYHADDIAAASPTRHTPPPGASGGVIVSDGTKWTRQDALPVGSISGGSAQYQYLVTGPGPGFTPGWSGGYLDVAAGQMWAVDPTGAADTNILSYNAESGKWVIASQFTLVNAVGPATCSMAVATTTGVTTVTATGTTPGFEFSNNVGIGTNPTKTLDVYGDSASGSSSEFPAAIVRNASVANHSFAAVYVDGNNDSVVGALLADGLGTGSAISGSDAGIFIGTTTNHILALGTNNSERMRIDTSGNVGVGTSAPGARLHVDQTVTGVASNYISHWSFMRADASANNARGYFAGAFSGQVVAGNTRNYTRTAGGVIGLYGEVVHGGSGIISLSYGVGSVFTCSGGGNVTEHHAFHVHAPSLTSGSVDTFVGLDIPNLTIGTTNYAIRTRAGLIVLNEDGSSASTVRIEGDTDENLFVTDAINDRVGVGTNAPGVKFHVASSTLTTRAYHVVGRIEARVTGGVAAGANFGPALEFYGESATDTNYRQMGLVSAVWSDATDLTRRSRLEFRANYTSTANLIGVLVSDSQAIVDGNDRGIGAIELQVYRSAANQVASGKYAIIIGGNESIASGEGSTVLGGAKCVADATSCYAQGYYARTAGHNGSWVLSDYQAVYFDATRDNQMAVRMSGGYLFTAGDVEIDSNKAYYIGEKDTDGSYRIIRNGSRLDIECRVSGSYVRYQSVPRVITTIAADTNITSAHDIVIIDASANNVTATLPAASTRTGLIYTFVRIDSSVIYSVTIDGNGAETINGQLTQSILSQYDSFTIISTGSEWITA